MLEAGTDCTKLFTEGRDSVAEDLLKACEEVVEDKDVVHEVLEGISKGT